MKSKKQRGRTNASLEQQSPAKQDLMRQYHARGITTIRLCSMFAVSMACAVQVVYGAFSPLGSIVAHALKNSL
jgi:hypothetical protein